MPDEIDICLVCLRTDIMLKVIDPRLSDLCEELCDYSYYSFGTSDPKFCAVCEHLLRKLYNFKEKCVLAINILQKWNKKKDDKKPLSLLYTLLPQSAFGIWRPSNTKTFYLEEEPKPVPSNSTPSSEPVSKNRTPSTEPVSSNSTPSSEPVSKNKTLSTEPVSNNITPSTHPILNMPILTPAPNKTTRWLVPNLNTLNPGTVLIINALQTSATKPLAASVNVPRPLRTCLNVPSQNIGTSVPVSRNVLQSINVRNSHPDNIFPMEKFVFVDNSQQLDNDYSNQGPIENQIPINDIKLETNCDDDSQVLNLEEILKTEEETFPIFEIVPEHTIICKNVEASQKNDKQPQIEDDAEKVEYIDDSMSNSDNDIGIDDVLDDTILNHNDVNETGSSINSDDIRDIDKALDDSSIDGDYNDDKVKENNKSPTVKNKSLTELANITLSDDDFITNNETEVLEEEEDEEVNVTDDDENEEWNTANKIIADIKNINAELDSINDNYEKKIIQTGNIIQKNNKHNIIRKNKTRRKQVFEKFIIINNEMDAIQENCNYIINLGEGPQFIQNRTKELKDKLRAKFESCGELKSAKGVIIDKEHVLNCLERRACHYLIEVLWKAVNHKGLNVQAVKILAYIQNKYRNSKYESVFDIEYINTPEAMKEEFQKRQTYPWYIKARHRCELCYTVYNCGKHLEKHKRSHDESAGDLVCSICDVRHKTRRIHLRHNLHSHDAVYKCKLCPLVTYYKNSMKHHFNQHKGVQYRCEPCNKTFGSVSAYNTHRAYAHRRNHVCTTCGRTFDTEEVRDTHKKSHRGEPTTDSSTSVKCDECELTFPSQQVYERHTRFTHGAAMPWGPIRSQMRTESEEVPGGRVKWTRTRIRSFTCPVCNEHCGSKSRLQLHCRSEHNEELDELNKRRFLCDVCGKGFKYKQPLRDHLNMHTGERPFACESCPKRFYKAPSLQIHRQYHLPPTHLCTRCGKKFHSQANLYTHTKTHIGNRHFKCNICGKGFLYNAALKEHVRGVHFNVRRVRKRAATEAGGGASEAGGSGGAKARGARTSTVASTKRRKRRKVESTDDSSDSD